jgi:hypothetical protein
MRRILAIVATLAALGACTATPVERLDLTAQRAEYENITLPWLRYVEADPALVEEQKAIRRASAAAQDLRIRKAEQSAGITR